MPEGSTALRAGSIRDLASQVLQNDVVPKTKFPTRLEGGGVEGRGHWPGWSSRHTAARRSTAAQPSQHRGGRTTAVREQAAAVRDWARSNGYEVSDRGRIPGRTDLRPLRDPTQQRKARRCSGNPEWTRAAQSPVSTHPPSCARSPASSTLTPRAPPEGSIRRWTTCNTSTSPVPAARYRCAAQRSRTQLNPKRTLIPYRCSQLPRCSSRALFSVAYIAERDRPLMSINCAALYSPDS